MTRRIILATFFAVFLSGFFSSSIAQELLSLDDAIRTGLENNYGIQISRNLQTMAENNHSLGNAGFLPAFDLTGGHTESVQDSKFESADGNSQTNRGARSSNTNAAVNLNWTLFDGLQMFSAYNRLNMLNEQSNKQLRLDMELLVSRIALTYYNISRISEQLKILENNLEVSLERIEIEETKLDLGSGSEYDLLQARSDLNADRAAHLREKNNLAEAKIALNELLSRSPGNEFEVNREININRTLLQQDLYQKLISQNTDLSLARLQQDISGIEIKEIRGERFPEISLNSSYSFSRNQNDGGFFRLNESTGFSAGITARLRIFDGFSMNRRIDNARINHKNAGLSLEERKLQLESDFLALYRSYLNSIELVDLEQQTLENAEQTLDIALERFRLGTISSLEFREAQRTYLAVENRLINAKFEAKVAETELLLLTGDFQVLTGR